MSIVQSGTRFTLEDVTNTFTKLPTGNYILKHDPRIGYYLNKKEDFELPKKVYGDHSIVNRWLKSWEVNSSKNLGIVLSGVKGSGKTITAQKFCVDSTLPVIIINEPFQGSDFIDFVTSPKLGKCIIFIDEFEKIYSNTDKQYDMLSLMDGNYATSLIFLLTVNEERLNDYLINRLNRIKYRKNYGDLEYDVMNEVIDDMLINKDHKQSIYDFFDKVNMRTFDLLTNLIKEMNLFNEDAIQCGMHLNLKPSSKTYQVFEIFNGKEYEMYSTNWNPSNSVLEFHRRNLDYLPQKPKEEVKTEASLEEQYEDTPVPTNTNDIYYRWYNWEVELEIEECEITRAGKMINVFHTETGLRFRMKEESTRMSLVF